MTPRCVLLALVPLLSQACGGPKAPPPAVAQSAPEGADAGDDAAAATPDDTKSSDAAAPDAPASASAAPPPPAPPPDECTPIAVDFEKRARPKLKDCYREGKKKDPNLEGTVRIAVDVNMLGKITSTKIAQKTLPDPVAQCMLKVVKATPFPEAGKCPGKSLTIPIQFPTPH
jgi:hypothetical protein